jgi:phosphoserine phosphatase RsbU/P
MEAARLPRVLVCGADPEVIGESKQLLERSGHIVNCSDTENIKPDELLTFDLVIIDGTAKVDSALQLCRRLRAHLADTLLPILFVAGNHAPASRLPGLESGSDTTLVRPFTPGEFISQVKALLRLKGIHDRQAEKAAEFHHLNRRLQQTYQQINHELELARRIQHSMLPQSLPEMPSLRFAVHYRPCGRVGGDFYDVFRLDEHHVGLYVADVMGHGVPASLLTMFLKKAVQTKEIAGSSYRLLPPDEVLQRLNREMLDQALAENPFITMVYAVFDQRDHRLTFSRAGHPHPLYMPVSELPRFWEVQGTLLGVFDTDFTVQTHRLRPGEKVIFYTDGLDTHDNENHSTTGQRLAILAEKYQQLSVADLVARLSQELIVKSDYVDDLTLLGLEVAR